MDKLFLAGLAAGLTFCNRQSEKKLIKQNIKNITHTLIVSPRRYGKTSLILEVLRAANTPYASIQFFNAFRDEVVVKRIVTGFNGLLSQIISPSKRTLLKLGQWITHAKLVLRTHGIETEFGLEPIAKDPIDIIKGLLEDIELILKKQKKHAIIFFDEFQDILNSDLSDELQSILRDFIQKTDCMTFIISGSNRHMLLKMFDDRSKPFYKLFNRINLQRIDYEHYEFFLQQMAIKQWKKKLSQEVVSTILNVSENHAYYFNRLCQKIWNSKTIPMVRDVETSWQFLADEEFSSVALELSALSKNQRIVLQAMAKYKELSEPAGTVFLSEVGLSHGSVLLAIQALEKIDLIERKIKSYRLIDPMMKFILLN